MKLKKTIIVLVILFCTFIISFFIGKGVSYIFKDDINDNSTISSQQATEKNNDFESYNPSSAWHKSDIEIPTQEQCQSYKKIALEGLADTEQQKISEELFSLHWELDNLFYNHSSILEDSDSPYWLFYIKAGSYEQPNHPETVVVYDGELTLILENLTEITSKIKNSEVKKDLQKACKLFEEGIENHSLNTLFEAHEIIHDYANWIFNMPYKSSVSIEPDRDGTWVYFGKPSIM